jgi:hypothetical protein
VVFANCFLVTPGAKGTLYEKIQGDRGVTGLYLCDSGIDLMLLPWAFYLRRYHLALRTLRNLYGIMETSIIWLPTPDGPTRIWSNLI